MVTSAICASMCTCIGITSRRSTTSRIDFHARVVVRTSRVLVSSTADTPTRSPSTWRVTLALRSEEHTSELQSLMRISYAVFCLKKKTQTKLKQDQKQ